MSRVHIISGPAGKTPKVTGKAIIDGQGSIPYPSPKESAAPDTEDGIMITGKKKGMRSALRGSRFKSC
jgi:hypothetical protein